MSARSRVLIVDDELLIRWALSESLARHGCEVVDADSAAAAANRLRTAGPFQLVLLDLRLPDCDDLTLLTTVRRLAPSTPVVLMTAYGTPNTVESALALGAACVIHKPFDLPAVLSLCDSLLGADDAP